MDKTLLRLVNNRLQTRTFAIAIPVTRDVQFTYVTVYLCLM